MYSQFWNDPLNRYFLLTKKIKISALLIFALFALLFGQKVLREIQAVRQPDAPEKQTYVNAQEGLQMREDSSTNAKTIKTLPYGAKLSLVEQNNDWLKVEDQENVGWVAKEFTVEHAPKDLRVEDVDFSKIVNVMAGVSQMGPIEYADYNNDGRVEALVTIKTEGTSSYGQFFVYGFKDGTTFTKYLDLRPDTLPILYKEGYMGQEKLKFEDDKFVLEYPVYKLTDAFCCPSGGNIKALFKWDGNGFIIDSVNKG